MNINSYLCLLLLFAGGFFLTIGDIVMKLWVIKNNAVFYFYGLINYLIGLNFLAYSFKYKNIAVASVMMIVFNLLMLYLANWLLFKEKISLLQTFGLFLGLCSIIILELADGR